MVLIPSMMFVDTDTPNKLTGIPRCSHTGYTTLNNVRSKCREPWFKQAAWYMKSKCLHWSRCMLNCLFKRATRKFPSRTFVFCKKSLITLWPNPHFDLCRLQEIKAVTWQECRTDWFVQFAFSGAYWYFWTDREKTECQCRNQLWLNVRLRALITQIHRWDVNCALQDQTSILLHPYQ